MVNRIGRIHKLGNYNRRQSVVTNRSMNTTLPNSNSRDNYNEYIDVENKEAITAETYSRPIND